MIDSGTKIVVEYGNGSSIAMASKLVKDVSSKAVSGTSQSDASGDSDSKLSSAKLVDELETSITADFDESKVDAKIQAATNNYAAPEQVTENEFRINEGLTVDQTGKKIIVKWGKVSNADGYDIYIQYCGKKFDKKATKSIKKASTTKASITKISGKSINLKKNFKVYVAVYKKVSGRKLILGKSIEAHVVGSKNKTYTNVKAIRCGKVLEYIYRRSLLTPL